MMASGGILLLWVASPTQKKSAIDSKAIPGVKQTGNAIYQNLSDIYRSVQSHNQSLQ